MRMYEFAETKLKEGPEGGRAGGRRKEAGRGKRRKEGVKHEGPRVLCVLRRSVGCGCLGAGGAVFGAHDLARPVRCRVSPPFSVALIVRVSSLLNWL